MPSGGSSAAYPNGSPMPGANFGGSQQAVPSAAGGTTPAVGGQTNPFLPSIPGGQSQPAASSPYMGDGLNVASQGNSSLNVEQSGKVGAPYGSTGNENAFLNSMKHAGIGQGVGKLLWNFLQGGAGFNANSAQALIAALKPQHDQAQANMMEQLSTSGNRNSSPAAYGLSQLESQFQLDYGQIFSQMYEQSVQNYINVLTMGKGEPQKSGFENFATVAGGIGSLFSGIGALKSK